MGSIFHIGWFPLERNDRPQVGKRSIERWIPGQVSARGDGDSKCVRQAVVVGVPVLLPLVAVPRLDAESHHAFGDGGCDASGRRILIGHRVATLPEHRPPFVLVDPVGGLVFDSLAVVVDLTRGTKPVIEEQHFVLVEFTLRGVLGEVLEDESRVEEVVPAQGRDHVPSKALECDVGPHVRVEAFLGDVLGLDDLRHRDGEHAEDHGGDHACDQQLDDRESAVGSRSYVHSAASSSS
jgi:hypothetical protein